MEYNQLKASIAAVIKTNNRKEITGQLLQNVLFQMTNVIGENLQLAGFATPLTDPHEPDQNLFYITDQGGVYPHFDNLTVDDGLTFLMWKNGEWTSHTVGVVTQEWVDSHYVSIEFFRSLFRAYDSAGLEILPNNNPEEALPTVVDNIKAMVGFWTEQYISALGQQTGGGGGGGATSLDELSDVFLTNPSEGQALVFDSASGMWINKTIQAGTDMATVWAALAGNTTQQINISHLTDALADYATKTYVDQNFITVAYFDRLFRAYNGNTLVSHNDVTSTIDNIKAMFGFWTEQYLSALGNNSGGGGQLLALSNMADVTLTTPIADKQVLTFDVASGKWVNGSATGASSIATLTDVTLTSLQAYQILIYDGNKWINTSLKTINGNLIFGTGDIPASGGGTGAYLPLAGGYMVGSIYFNNGGTYGANGQYARLVATSDHIGGLVLQLGSGNGQFNRFEIINQAWSAARFIVENDGTVSFGKFISGNNGAVSLNAPFYLGSDVINVPGVKSILRIMQYNGYPTFPIAAGTMGIGMLLGVDENGDPTIGTYGQTSATQIRLGGRVKVDLGLEIYNTSDNLPYIDFHYNNSSADFTSRIIEYASGQLTLECAVGIGTGTRPSYTLHVGGTIYATGAITALSDARKKDIMGEAGISVEQIAHAPAVQFLWKDKKRRKDGQQVGTLAQYWQTVLPEVVSDKGGELSMQYGVTALVSAIVTARKVVDHERRIQALEDKERRLG